MKLSHWIGIVGLAALLAPAFAATLAAAEDAPVPLPRRTDRMPVIVEVPELNPGAAPVAAAPGGDLTSVPDPAPLAVVETPAPPPTDAAAATPAASAAEALAKPQGKPQPVTLVAKITDDGADIPDGIVWRVFETRTDATGELALAAKSTDAVAHLELIPGNYVVHVAYGRAQTTDTITVGEGENDKSLVIDAGAMRLNAAIAGDIPIPINQLKFDIFSSSAEGSNTIVAQGLSPSDIVTLNAGTYHVVSHFGDINAVVRADLRVEPGQLTDATLYHKAAQVSFKLVSEAGGEAIADIDWTVKTADGQTVYTNTGAFPSTVLAEGDYLVLAKRGETVYNRGFQVQPGPAREIEVLTTVY